MKVYFEIKPGKKIEDEIKSLAEGTSTSRTISLEYLPEEEFECFDGSKRFIGRHIGCDFYIAVQQDGSRWGKPLTMVAVER